MTGIDQIDALLCAYDDWRRAQRWQRICGYGQRFNPCSLLGYLRRKVVKGNDWLAGWRPDEWDESLMLRVGQALNSLPPNQADNRIIRPIVWEHYCGVSWWTAERKARRCRVSVATYYRRLSAGKGLIAATLDISSSMRGQ